MRAAIYAVVLLLWRQTRSAEVSALIVVALLLAACLPHASAQPVRFTPLVDPVTNAVPTGSQMTARMSSDGRAALFEYSTSSSSPPTVLLWTEGGVVQNLGLASGYTTRLQNGVSNDPSGLDGLAVFATPLVSSRTGSLRWTPVTGWRSLGNSSPLAARVIVTSSSRDGQVAAGFLEPPSPMQSGFISERRAFVWTEAAGVVIVPLPPAPSGAQFHRSESSVMLSGDGRVVFGFFSYFSATNQFYIGMFRWRLGTGTATDLGPSPSSSSIGDVNLDGSLVLSGTHLWQSGSGYVSVAGAFGAGVEIDSLLDDGSIAPRVAPLNPSGERQPGKLWMNPYRFEPIPLPTGLSFSGSRAVFARDGSAAVVSSTNQTYVWRANDGLSTITGGARCSGLSPLTSTVSIEPLSSGGRRGISRWSPQGVYDFGSPSERRCAPGETGRVVWEDGTPIAGAEVFMYYRTTSGTWRRVIGDFNNGCFGSCWRTGCGVVSAADGTFCAKWLLSVPKFADESDTRFRGLAAALRLDTASRTSIDGYPALPEFTINCVDWDLSRPLSTPTTGRERIVFPFPVVLQSGTNAQGAFSFDWLRWELSESRPVSSMVPGERPTPAFVLFAMPPSNVASWGYSNSPFQSSGDLAESARRFQEELLEARIRPVIQGWSPMGWRNVRVSVIGHSLGGVIMRKWAVDYASRWPKLHRFVSIDAPHGGCTLASMGSMFSVLSLERMNGIASSGQPTGSNQGWNFAHRMASGQNILSFSEVSSSPLLEVIQPDDSPFGIGRFTTPFSNLFNGACGRFFGGWEFALSSSDWGHSLQNDRRVLIAIARFLVQPDLRTPPVLGSIADPTARSATASFASMPSTCTLRGPIPDTSWIGLHELEFSGTADGPGSVSFDVLDSNASLDISADASRIPGPLAGSVDGRIRLLPAGQMFADTDPITNCISWRRDNDVVRTMLCRGSRSATRWTVHPALSTDRFRYRVLVSGDPASLEGGYILSVVPAGDAVPLGQPARISVSIVPRQGGAGVRGAVSRAELSATTPSGQRVAIPIRDDGVAPDAVANDWLFTGELPSANEVGYWRLWGRLTINPGWPGRGLLDRSRSATMTVIGPNGTIGQPTFGPWNADADANPDGLLISVPATVPLASTYRISMSLRSPDGQRRVSLSDGVVSNAVAGQTITFAIGVPRASLEEAGWPNVLLDEITLTDARAGMAIGALPAVAVPSLADSVVGAPGSPTISGIWPSGGFAGAAQPLLVTGRGLSRVTGVRFNGSVPIAPTELSASSFRVTRPALACTGTGIPVTVELVTAQGISTASDVLRADCRPPCRADFNTDGLVSVNDIFVFLSAWFRQDPSTDLDQRNGVTVEDIFEFLRTWFAGC